MLWELTAELAAAGHEVTVMTLGGGEALGPAGVTVVRIGGGCAADMFGVGAGTGAAYDPLPGAARRAGDDGEPRSGQGSGRAE